MTPAPKRKWWRVIAHNSWVAVGALGALFVIFALRGMVDVWEEHHPTPPVPVEQGPWTNADRRLLDSAWKAQRGDHVVGVYEILPDSGLPLKVGHNYRLAWSSAPPFDTARVSAICARTFDSLWAARERKQKCSIPGVWVPILGDCFKNKNAKCDTVDWKWVRK